ncbi:MAG TPA: ArsR family transcriptional regulator, partial [Pyrinomonadaceae bacterium]|nr:ArsR family transcriptional regulator [Pyrinomonadaceae bacterium]
MSRTAFDERFFESTRGRIVLLLRQSPKTVNDLSKDLDLTDNAVRAHLLSLERDRLVESAGTVKGVRKPHVIYKLTDDARHIFPKSYDSLFNRFLDVLKDKLPKRSLSSMLHDVGQRIGRAKAI